MAAYTTFLPEVMPAVPGCPDLVAVDAIRKAAIDLCERGWILHYTHPAISAVAGTATYGFVPPANRVVCRVLQAWYNDIGMTPRTIDQLNEMYKNWTTESGTPTYFVQDDPTAMTIVPMPSADLAGAIKLRVALKPTQDSTEVDDFVYQNHLVTVGLGAKARLLMMDDKSWSNPKKAAFYQQQFDAKVDMARYRAQTGYGRAANRVKASFF